MNTDMNFSAETILEGYASLIAETNDLWLEASAFRAKAIERQQKSAQTIQNILSGITEAFTKNAYTVSNIDFKSESTSITGITVVYADPAGAIKKLEYDFKKGTL